MSGVTMVSPDRTVPLYGRESERHRIGDVLRRVASGEAARAGAVIFIAGDSGVGKSALAHSILQDAAGIGFDVFETACEPFHEGMSYFPVREIVRQVAGGRAAKLLVSDFFDPDSSEAEVASISESLSADPSTRREATVATFANAILGRF